MPIPDFAHKYCFNEYFSKFCNQSFFKINNLGFPINTCHIYNLRKSLIFEKSQIKINIIEGRKIVL